MKNKKFLFISLLILAIGFSAVSTTLYISGNLVFGTNKDDFEVYFSKAYLDDVDVYDDVISQDKKTITFTTKELKAIGDTSILEYQVMNNSREYDATVTVNCNISNSEYVSYTNTLNDTILAQTVEDGVLVVTLNKVSTEEVIETLTCSLVYNAVERTSQADLYDENTYVLSGYLQDEEGNELTNQNLVVYSETPHIVTTNSLGYFYVENLLNEKHEIYITNKTVNELEGMTKTEVVESALSKGTFKVTDETINLDNNYKLDKEKITISDSFDKTCADLVGTVYNYDYTGGEQTFEIPCNGTYKFELWGSEGEYNRSNLLHGSQGKGAYTSGEIELKKAESLYVIVGNNLGFNATPNSVECNGGGATDIRTDNSLYTRIMVAAGGGGASHSGSTCKSTGDGGGLIGYDADTYIPAATSASGLTTGFAGYGATQILGGKTGSNGYISYTSVMNGSFGIAGYNSSGTAGGGGWYGGGHGRHSGSNYAGGGGGSSYISGHAGSLAISSSSSLSLKSGCTSLSATIDCSESFTGYVFTNTKMIDGRGYNWTTSKGSYVGQPQPNGTTTAGHSGNGYARITLVSID